MRVGHHDACARLGEVANRAIENEGLLGEDDPSQYHVEHLPGGGAPLGGIIARAVRVVHGAHERVLDPLPEGLWFFASRALQYRSGHCGRARLKKP